MRDQTVTVTIVIPDKKGGPDVEVERVGVRINNTILVVLPFGQPFLDSKERAFSRRTATTRTGLWYLSGTQPGDLYPRIKAPTK